MLRPFTFSNGVAVPAGTEVAIPSSATHRDERVFTNPDVFDGFRFAKNRESEGDKTKNRCQTLHISRAVVFWSGATRMVGIPAL